MVCASLRNLILAAMVTALMVVAPPDCLSAPSPAPIDSDSDGVDDAVDLDWAVPIASAGGDFNWSSAFPIAEPGPWQVELRILDVHAVVGGLNIPLPAGVFAGLPSSTTEYAVAIGTPALITDQRVSVPDALRPALAADLRIEVDAGGYGHVAVTEVVLGSVEVSGFDVDVDSFGLDLRIRFLPISDCNQNGVPDSTDISSAASSDLDHDGVPDECGPDADGDGVLDSMDNCPGQANPEQADSDGDGQGDTCDRDWVVPMDTAGGSFSWVSSFPMSGDGPWRLDVRVLDFHVEADGAAAAVASLLQPLFDAQLLSMIDDSLLGLPENGQFVAGFPVEIAGGPLTVVHDGDVVFEGNVAVTIDAGGFGQLSLTEVRHGSVNVPVLGEVEIRSVSAALQFEFTELAAEDSDGDGLPDVAELAAGTLPLDPDTDDDGLTDGDEITRGTDPCRSDSDGDSVDDDLDPTPTVPGVTRGFLEGAGRALAASIHALAPTSFNGPSANANRGRRHALANRAIAAANAIAAGDEATALSELASLLEKVDGVAPPPDWMDESSEKALLAGQTRWLVTLMGY